MTSSMCRSALYQSSILKGRSCSPFPIGYGRTKREHSQQGIAGCATTFGAYSKDDRWPQNPALCSAFLRLPASSLTPRRHASRRKLALCERPGNPRAKITQPSPLIRCEIECRSPSKRGFQVFVVVVHAPATPLLARNIFLPMLRAFFSSSSRCSGR